MVQWDGGRSIKRPLADRIVFQGDETESEDKTFLREYEKFGNDANMDSVDSIFNVLSVEGKVQELGAVIYEFHIRDQDNAFPAYFTL